VGEHLGVAASVCGGGVSVEVPDGVPPDDLPWHGIYIRGLELGMEIPDPYFPYFRGDRYLLEVS
jgi:hypothetical protein